MATKPVPRFVDFSNVDVMFDRLLELGFLPDKEARDVAVEKLPEQHEHRFERGDVVVKVFRGLFGAFEIWNYSGSSDPVVGELFEVAALSKS